MPDEESLPLTKSEREVVKRIADRDGISEDEAATKLVKAALERRVRRRTGKGQARVFQIGRAGTPRR